jgi:zeaxanthin glucosyltransferase
VTTLVCSPDFASHWAPLGEVARAVAATGERVVVATGTTLRARVEDAGFAWRSLRLGRSSNDGVAAARDAGAAAALERFVAATRRGPAATLALQADERLVDLLFEPERVVAELDAIVAEVRPDRLVVDQVSFNSTLAATVTGIPFTTVSPGHPSQLPVGDERYGLPAAWPAAIRPTDAELDDLARRCDAVAERFTARWNATLAALAPHLPAVDDAFRVHGERVVLHWSAELHPPERTVLLPAGTVFAGPLTRPGDPVPLPPAWAAERHDRPRVVVALGTFLSHRGDVVARLADALRGLDVAAAVATGPTDPTAIGPVPDDWIVAERIPQVALLARADLAVSHGGNNSVQEARRAGVGQVLLPFSTDQFAIAAALEAHGSAAVLDPNRAAPDELAAAIAAVLAADRPDPVAPDLAAVVGAVLGGG